MILRILIISTGLFVAGCGESNTLNEFDLREEELSSTYDQFHVKPYELIELEARARAGDEISLKKVIDYYLLGSDPTKRNADKAIFWLKYAVDSGKREYLSDLLIMLGKSDVDCEVVMKYYRELVRYDQGVSVYRRDDLSRCIK